MRAVFLLVLFGFLSHLCMSQSDTEITEKRNLYNKKGDYYFEKKEYEKAILFYSMAYKQDGSDYFSVLKKADAFTKLKLYPQAEECYRIVFESGKRPDNIYKLKYALVLLENNKQEEFKRWINQYSEVVGDEIESDNYLISSEKRLQLYKDTSIVLTLPDMTTDTVAFKIKYAGYPHRRRTSPEDNMLNVLVSSGDEFYIPISANGDYEFSFQPLENYKLMIQKEDIAAEDILSDNSLSPDQKQKKFLNPPPLQKAEIIVPHGMKYLFSIGESIISQEYMNELKQTAEDYQDQGDNTIDLTALAKELEIEKGEIYTIRFIRDEKQDETYKKFEISNLFINGEAINIFGQSFLVIMPLESESNFKIETDLTDFEKNFNPKKYSLAIDDSPIFEKAVKSASDWLLPLTVNTMAAEEVLPARRLSGKEISIIPGTVYILTLSKPHPTRPDRSIEVVVPLTENVKYNLSSSQTSDVEYKAALAEFLMGREGLEIADEEVIDISLLSKELEVQPGEQLSFYLLPAKQYGVQPDAKSQYVSKVTVDGKEYNIRTDEKYTINIPYSSQQKVNLTTALDYVTENFAANSYTLMLDTVSFTSEIKVDTAGYGILKSSGWLSMSVNTNNIEEVEKQFQFIANEVSIIPGKEYILTVSKIDAETGKEDEIIVPLIRKVKYDFTADPMSEEAYQKSLQEFLASHSDLETTDGTVIDITLLSKELQIAEGDKVSFSLLPAKIFSKQPTPEDMVKSNLYLDNKVVEFTQIQKYTINMPLSEERLVNMQTNIEYIQENFEPGTYTLDVDTQSFFSEITIDTTGLGDRVIQEEVITDPVFDVIVINFDLNEHMLKPESKKIILENVVNELKADKRLYVTIKGYTDALGDADYNYRLSKRRAESVKAFLEENGIGESRIRTFSFGASQALQEGVDWSDLSEEELRKHRKVEIVIYLPE
jgi:outer membrane protein OmpA-like peptidoglycan-associated protein/tetratricopeptide (TPR) repeat protein